MEQTWVIFSDLILINYCWSHKDHRLLLIEHSYWIEKVSTLATSCSKNDFIRVTFDSFCDWATNLTSNVPYLGRWHTCVKIQVHCFASAWDASVSSSPHLFCEKWQGWLEAKDRLSGGLLGLNRPGDHPRRMLLQSLLRVSKSHRTRKKLPNRRGLVLQGKDAKVKN